jgi:hypothetical protein
MACSNETCAFEDRQVIRSTASAETPMTTLPVGVLGSKYTSVNAMQLRAVQR